MWSAIMAQIDDVKKLFPQMDDKTAEIALECCNNNEVNVRFPDHPQILLSRRIRDDPYGQRKSPPGHEVHPMGRSEEASTACSSPAGK